MFVDEVQEIVKWEKAILSFFNKGDIDIFITGSNAHILSSELATYLSGRYIEFPIYSLSFKEFLQFRGKSKKSQNTWTYINEKNLEACDIENIELLPLLFKTGYLTIKDWKSEKEILVDLPNEEVRSAFNMYLFKAITDNYKNVNKEIIIIGINFSSKQKNIQKYIIIDKYVDWRIILHSVNMVNQGIK